MRSLSRFLPILVGLVLGYLLMSPPEWLASLGPWRWLAVAAIVLLGLLAFTAWQLSANLPADPPLEPAAEAEVSGELRDLCAASRSSTGTAAASPPGPSRRAP